MSDPHEEVDEPDTGISTLPPAAPSALSTSATWRPLPIPDSEDQDAD